MANGVATPRSTERFGSETADRTAYGMPVPHMPDGAPSRTEGNSFGPMYLIEPIVNGYETVCQPWVVAGRTFPNCGQRHRTVDDGGWVQVPESGDSV